ncbi:MAG: disulfide bond formation protein DsbA [Ilumatobacteraceae bacterium]
MVHVDPSCPFAWITFRWLSEVERSASIDLHVRLLSLSVVNEDRPLDDWYRDFNDKAWAPARVMAATGRQHGDGAARRFYQSFGERFHVQLGTGDDVDRRAVALHALAAAALPDALIDAADDPRWDDELRTTTNETLDRVGLDVGVPVVEIDGAAVSGPVMTAIPRGPAAVAVFDAVCVLARHPGFTRLERRRTSDLQTA